jgi:Zn-dependent protease with chaperone function
MTMTQALSKYRVLFAILTAFAMMIAVAPVAHMAPPDPLGIDAARPTVLGDEDLVTTITSIINVALGLLGIIAVVIVLIGGFKWMTAGGNEEKVTEARKLIISGVIGIAIILSAYAIASFVVNRLGAATGAEGF